MIDWIRRKFYQFVGGIGDLAIHVGDGFTWFWHLLVQFWTMVKAAMGYLAMVANGFRDFLYSFAKSTYAALRHALLVVIPAYADLIWRRAVAFATQLVDNAKTFLHGLIVSVENFAKDAINALTGFAHGIVTWATGLFHDIVNTLTHVADRVAQLLTDPGALALWLIGSLWSVAWRFAFAQREAIARWVMARALGVTVEGASIVEDILTKIL